MLIATCVDKIQDKNGRITGYVLQDTYGNKKLFKAEVVKAGIINHQLIVTNLKLTSDNRLISAKADSINSFKESKAGKEKQAKTIEKQANKENKIQAVEKQVKTIEKKEEQPPILPKSISALVDPMLTMLLQKLSDKLKTKIYINDIWKSGDGIQFTHAITTKIIFKDYGKYCKYFVGANAFDENDTQEFILKFLVNANNIRTLMIVLENNRVLSGGLGSRTEEYLKNHGIKTSLKTNNLTPDTMNTLVEAVVDIFNKIHELDNEDKERIKATEIFYNKIAEKFKLSDRFEVDNRYSAYKSCNICTLSKGKHAINFSFDISTTYKYFRLVAGKHGIILTTRDSKERDAVERNSFDETEYAVMINMDNNEWLQKVHDELEKALNNLENNNIIYVDLPPRKEIVKWFKSWGIIKYAAELQEDEQCYFVDVQTHSKIYLDSDLIWLIPEIRDQTLKDGVWIKDRYFDILDTNVVLETHVKLYKKSGSLSIDLTINGKAFKDVLTSFNEEDKDAVDRYIAASSLFFNEYTKFDYSYHDEIGKATVGYLCKIREGLLRGIRDLAIRNDDLCERYVLYDGIKYVSKKNEAIVKVRWMNSSIGYRVQLMHNGETTNTYFTIDDTIDENYTYVEIGNEQVVYDITRINRNNNKLNEVVSSYIEKALGE